MGDPRRLYEDLICVLQKHGGLFPITPSGILIRCSSAMKYSSSGPRLRTTTVKPLIRSHLAPMSPLIREQVR